MPTLTPDLVFTAANYSVLPFWLLLAVAPRWRLTQVLVHSVLMPLLLGATYLWLFASGAFFGPQVPDNAGFATLDGLMVLFTVKEAVVAGWIHYLVFDLFVGAWIVRDSGRMGIWHVWVVPCLVLTLVLGPVGLLAYLLLRMALKERFLLDESR
jgi:hypothetical protein